MFEGLESIKSFSPLSPSLAKFLSISQFLEQAQLLALTKKEKYNFSLRTGTFHEQCFDKLKENIDLSSQTGTVRAQRLAA